MRRGRPKTRHTGGDVGVLSDRGRQASERVPSGEPGGEPLAAGYDLWNCTDIVDGEGAGVTSVSVIVLPFALSTKVFSRVTLP